MKTAPFISRKSGPLKGAGRVPGDKSISHRAVMIGSLAPGETLVYGLLEGEDVMATAAAMRAMGAKIERSSSGVWHIHGVGLGNLQQPSGVLDMGNSGTSTRLLMGILAGHDIKASFNGDASLVKRPMERVITPLSQMGATFEASAGGRLPLTMQGTKNPEPVTYELPVASAQVKSAVLLAGLNAQGVTTVIDPEGQTRDHTENMLRHFGMAVNVKKRGDGAEEISITGGQQLHPCAVDVPGDPSSAAFPAVAAVINPGSDIQLTRVGISDRRDGIYRTLRDMGADIEYKNIRTEGGEKVADIIVKASSLKGISVPPDRVTSMIDEIPVLAMAAACANGTTHFSNLSELRKKESDRLLLVYEGLKSCGVNVEMNDKEHTLAIHGTGKPPRGGAKIKTHLDHRIAMAFLVLGTATDQPVTVDDIEPVKTSFPGFDKTMNGYGAHMEPAPSA